MLSSTALGKLNAVDRPVVQKIVHLNTKFRDNYYNSSESDFFYRFPVTIKNALSVRVHSIDIPNTSYTFCSKIGSNSFTIRTHKREVAEGYFQKYDHIIEQSEHKIEIPSGNYSGTALTEYLNTTYFYQSGTTTDLQYLKFSIQEHGLKTRLEVLGIAPKDFMYSVRFINLGSQSIVYTMGWTLGFRMGKYLNIRASLISEGCFDTGGDRYIYMSLNDYHTSHTNDNLIALDNNFVDKNILGKIYLRDGKFHVSIDDEDAPYNLKKRTFNGPVDFEKIHIKLLDEYGNIFYLNHMDFSFALEFEILYENWCY